MDNTVKLETYFSPDERKGAVGRFVAAHNDRRCQESLDNVTPADANLGQKTPFLRRREKTKVRTMTRRCSGSAEVGTNRSLK